MLGYLEQRPLYNAANFNWGPYPVNPYTAINNTVANTVIKGFLCPSDPNSGSGTERRRRPTGATSTTMPLRSAPTPRAAITRG